MKRLQRRLFKYDTRISCPINHVEGAVPRPWQVAIIKLWYFNALTVVYVHLTFYTSVCKHRLIYVPD